MTLDRRLTWKQHHLDKSKQLRDKLKKFYWLIDRRSNLSTQNKITLYKTVIKPVWTYGIQLWGTASNSYIEILQRFQSKTLRSLLNAPWYVTNETIHRDLKSRYLQSKMKYTSPEADITQESRTTTTH